MVPSPAGRQYKECQTTTRQNVVKPGSSFGFLLTDKACHLRIMADLLPFPSIDYHCVLYCSLLAGHCVNAPPVRHIDFVLLNSINRSKIGPMSDHIPIKKNLKSDLNCQNLFHFAPISASNSTPKRYDVKGVILMFWIHLSD